MQSTLEDSIEKKKKTLLIDGHMENCCTNMFPSLFFFSGTLHTICCCFCTQRLIWMEYEYKLIFSAQIRLYRSYLFKPKQQKQTENYEKHFYRSNEFIIFFF